MISGEEHLSLQGPLSILSTHMMTPPPATLVLGALTLPWDIHGTRHTYGTLTYHKLTILVINKLLIINKS